MSIVISSFGIPIKILMIEDNEGDVLLTQEALNDSQILNELFHVTNGEQAYQFLLDMRHRKPQALPGLLLMDINMPRLSGHELTRAIKKDEILAKIPIFIFSSSRSPDDIRQSQLNNINHYLTKPLDVNQFMRGIQLIPHFTINSIEG